MMIENIGAQYMKLGALVVRRYMRCFFRYERGYTNATQKD